VVVRATVLSIVLAACGRVAFDPREDARIADATSDAATVVDCPRGDFCLESVPTTEDLFGVWARSAADVWAVGRNGTILHRTDGTWRVVPSGASDVLLSVWAAPDSDAVIVVGQNARFIRLTNETVTLSTSGGPVFNGVWGFASDHFYVVNSSGTVLRCDATSCVDKSTGVTGVLFTVWGSGADDLWIGSLGNDLFHSTSGNTWVLEDPPSANDDWFAGWASSPTDVWAVGYTMERYDGTTWTTVDTSAFNYAFDAVHGLDGRMWFYGLDGVSSWNGSTLVPVASPITGDIQDMHGADGVLWFVGDLGTIYVHQP
jgi:hypothetical protein